MPNVCVGIERAVDRDGDDGRAIRAVTFDRERNAALILSLDGMHDDIAGSIAEADRDILGPFDRVHLLFAKPVYATGHEDIVRWLGRWRRQKAK